MRWWRCEVGGDSGDESGGAGGCEVRTGENSEQPSCREPPPATCLCIAVTAHEKSCHGTDRPSPRNYLIWVKASTFSLPETHVMEGGGYPLAVRGPRTSPSPAGGLERGCPDSIPIAMNECQPKELLLRQSR